jgi:hypothetical protein
MRRWNGTAATCGTRPGSSTARLTLVRTGRGVLCWPHDLDGWRRWSTDSPEARRRPAPLRRSPVHLAFESEGETYECSGPDYFAHADSKAKLSTRYHERLRTLSDVFGALTRADPKVEHEGRTSRRAPRRVPGKVPEPQARVEGENPPDLLDRRAARCRSQRRTLCTGTSPSRPARRLVSSTAFEVYLTRLSHERYGVLPVKSRPSWRPPG